MTCQLVNIYKLHLESVVEDGLAGEADEAGGEGEPLHQLDLRRQDPPVDLVLAVAFRVPIGRRMLQQDVDKVKHQMLSINRESDGYDISCEYFCCFIWS